MLFREKWSTVEIIQGSKFKFLKGYRKVGQSRLPQMPRFRLPCVNIHMKDPVNIGGFWHASPQNVPLMLWYISACDKVARLSSHFVHR